MENLNEKQQIEEMAKVMCGGCADGKECMQCLCADWYRAEKLYNAGYRKQSEGEWEPHKDFNPFLRTDVIGGYICSCCENESDETTKFCPKCGASMKGGAE